jgi:hypothetical protein
MARYPKEERLLSPLLWALTALSLLALWLGVHAGATGPVLWVLSLWLALVGRPQLLQAEWIARGDRWLEQRAPQLWQWRLAARRQTLRAWRAILACTAANALWLLVLLTLGTFGADRPLVLIESVLGPALPAISWASAFLLGLGLPLGAGGWFLRRRWARPPSTDLRVCPVITAAEVAVGLQRRGTSLMWVLLAAYGGVVLLPQLAAQLLALFA